MGQRAVSRKSLPEKGEAGACFILRESITCGRLIDRQWAAATQESRKMNGKGIKTDEHDTIIGREDRTTQLMGYSDEQKSSFQEEKTGRSA